LGLALGDLEGHLRHGKLLLGHGDLLLRLHRLFGAVEGTLAGAASS
jgi:hypothetical protein